MSLIEDLLASAEKGYNTLLIGRHGVGKTAMVEEVTKSLGLKLKYYSASTLDPWADIVGIPVPDQNTKSLDFFRPKDIEDAEFIFFDELNRAHPRVLNAVLEIVQKKSVNGVPLKNLKMVWAAINPPGDDYNVEDLDPALVDRFHLYFNIKATFNMAYMETKMEKPIAQALRAWWLEDLDEAQRELVTPRRLEYLGCLIQDGINWNNALPIGATLPATHLVMRLDEFRNGETRPVYEIEAMVENPGAYIERLRADARDAIKLKDILIRANADQMYGCRDIIESLPGDLVMAIGSLKFRAVKRTINENFKSEGVDINEYPKIKAAFHYDEEDL